MAMHWSTPQAKTTTPAHYERIPNSAGRRSGTKAKEYETDPHRLAQRQKQIMYGENTAGYMNFIKAVERDPALLQGCVPVKPSIVQRCSKRSWDGQVRKWRRALHMYDYVDFGTDAEESQKVRQALIAQTRNPLFRGEEGEESREVLANEYVRYTFQDMLALSESPIIAQSIKLPDSIAWLDKRVDLEDDVEDDDEPFLLTTPGHLKSPSRISPTPSPTQSPARPLPAKPEATANLSPPAGMLFNPSISPQSVTITPRTPNKTPSPTFSLSPLMHRAYPVPSATVPVYAPMTFYTGGTAEGVFAPIPYCWSPPAADRLQPIQPLFSTSSAGSE